MYKVLLAKTLSSTSHIGQRYGTENYLIKQLEMQ